MSDTTSDLAALGESIAEVLAAECDSRKLHAFIDGKNALDKTLWQQAGELGWLAAGLPEACGGLGLGVGGLAALHRELGRRTAPGPFLSTLSAAQALAECADDATRAKVLPRVAAGELAICVPAAPFAASGELSLSGGRVSGKAKELLGAATAGAVLTTLRDASGSLAWALIEVDGKSARLSAEDLWDPTRALCTLDCDGAVATLLSGDAAGLARWRETLAAHMALATAFDSVGGAEAVLQLTLDYMKTRVQFDKPIASFQALKHRAANLKIEADLAGHAAAQGLHAALGLAAESGFDPDRQVWAALAKAAASDAYVLIAGDCVQLHGGVGFTWEFDCQLYQKRAHLNQALVEPNDGQLDRAAAGLAAATRSGRTLLELAL